MAARTPSSPPVPAPLHAGAFLAIVFLAAFTLFYLCSLPLFTDTDTPWHIATGQLILETGSVPTADPWSYTAPGNFWLNYSWGWDLILALVHRSFGLSGVFVFSQAWLAGTIALLGFVLLKRGGASQDPVMIALALAAMILLASIGARPQEFSYLAAVVVHAMLHFNRKSRRPGRILWQLPLFMILWVNMHSGFIFGFIILGAYGLEALMLKQWMRFNRLVYTGLLCLLAIHVTPLFPALGLHYLPAVYASITTPINFVIREWQPYRFQQYAGFDALILVLFLSANFKDRAVPIADRILTSLWLFAALYSIRNFPLLAAVAAPSLALRLEAVLLHKSASPLLKLRHGELAWVAVISLCIALVSSPLKQLLTHQDPVINDKHTPIEALTFLREHYPHLRFLHSWGFGGYMIYYNRDVHQVFCDGRGPTVYSYDFVRNTYIRIAQLKPIDDQVARYGVQGYFMANEYPALLKMLERDPNLKMVYRDKVAVVFVKRGLARYTGPIATPEELEKEAAE